MLTTHSYLDHARGWPAGMLEHLLASVTADLGWQPVVSAEWQSKGRTIKRNWRPPTAAVTRDISQAMESLESFHGGWIHDAQADWTPNQRLDATSFLHWQVSHRYLDREDQIPLRLSLHLQSRAVPTARELSGVPTWFLDVATRFGVVCGSIGIHPDAASSQREIFGGGVSIVGQPRTPEELHQEATIRWYQQFANRVQWPVKARAASWANLLSAGMVEQLGGLANVQQTAPVDKHAALPEGRVYLQLTDTPPAPGDNMYADRLAQLAAWMAPATLPPPPAEWMAAQEEIW